MQRRNWVLGLLGLASCKRKSKLPELGNIPPFEFTDQSGRTFSSRALQGKIWVADFFFTNCPGPCPRMANQLQRVQEETSGLTDSRIVSITVDPERDTVAVLGAWAARFHADVKRWVFLTGRKDLIKNLMSEAFYLGFADGMQEHSTKFVVVDRTMHIRGFYDSFAKEDIDKMIQDIRELHDHS